MYTCTHICPLLNTNQALGTTSKAAGFYTAQNLEKKNQATISVNICLGA